MNQKQGVTLNKKEKKTSGGVSLSQQRLYNMELLECVQTREFGQQLRHPHLTHVVSRDQLCVTLQHNQSVDITFIDSLQNSLLLFDHLMLLFLLL